MRAYDDTARLDREAESDDARWAARMRAALAPVPAWGSCSACDGRALGLDAGPCSACAGTGVRRG